MCVNQPSSKPTPSLINYKPPPPRHRSSTTVTDMVNRVPLHQPVRERARNLTGSPRCATNAEDMRHDQGAPASRHTTRSCCDIPRRPAPSTASGAPSVRRPRVPPPHTRRPVRPRVGRSGSAGRLAHHAARHHVHTTCLVGPLSTDPLVREGAATYTRLDPGSLAAGQSGGEETHNRAHYTSTDRWTRAETSSPRASIESWHPRLANAFRLPPPRPSHLTAFPINLTTPGTPLLPPPSHHSFPSSTPLFSWRLLQSNRFSFPQILGLGFRLFLPFLAKLARRRGLSLRGMMGTAVELGRRHGDARFYDAARARRGHQRGSPKSRWSPAADAAQEKVPSPPAAPGVSGNLERFVAAVTPSVPAQYPSKVRLLVPVLWD
jgi:hypothetical protein